MYGIRLLSHVAEKAQVLRKKVHENKVLKGLVVFLSSLIVGILFYHTVHEWDWSLSYFYAASVLLGDLYLVPEDDLAYSEVFTLFYFLWGCVLMASALAISAQSLIDKVVKIAADERKRILQASRETEKLIQRQKLRLLRKQRHRRKRERERFQSHEDLENHTASEIERNTERECAVADDESPRREREKERERERDALLALSSSKSSRRSSWLGDWWGSGYQHKSIVHDKAEEEVDENDAGLSTRSMQGSERVELGAEGPTLTLYDEIVLAIDDIFLSIGWDYHRSKYFALSFIILWFLVGILYGLYFEGWTLWRSMYFSASAISAAGTSPPECEGDDASSCRLGTARSLILGTYIIFGVPIFGYSLEQFAEFLLEKVVRANELKLMMNPISRTEFAYVLSLREGVIPDQSVDDLDDVGGGGGVATPMSSASSRRSFSRGGGASSASSLFLSSSTVGGTGAVRDKTAERDRSGVSVSGAAEQPLRLNFGDFVILELLRLRKITKEDLEYIKSIYDTLNSRDSGAAMSMSHSGVATPGGLSLAPLSRERERERDRRASVLEPIVEEEESEMRRAGSWASSSLRQSLDFDSAAMRLERRRGETEIGVDKSENDEEEDNKGVPLEYVDLEREEEEEEETSSAKYLSAKREKTSSPPGPPRSPLSLDMSIVDAEHGAWEEDEDYEERDRFISYSPPPTFLRDLSHTDQDQLSMQYNQLLLPAMHQLQVQSQFFSNNADLESLADDVARQMLSTQHMPSPQLSPCGSDEDEDEELRIESDDELEEEDDAQRETLSERIPFLSRIGLRPMASSLGSDRLRERTSSKSERSRFW